MPKSGDSYIVQLRDNHLAWGTYRYTDSRAPRTGEAYLPIPVQRAREFGVYNENTTNGDDVLGENIFYCVTLRDYLKAQGCSSAGDIYAKQFAIADDLKGLGRWYRAVGAESGDSVRVTWISSTEVEIELIKNC